MLDLNLPDMDRFTVPREIRAHPRLSHLPVAILSSSRSPADVEKSFACRADRSVTKGTHIEEYGGSLRRLLEEDLPAIRQVAKRCLTPLPI